MRPYLKKPVIKMIIECVMTNPKYANTLMAAGLMQQLLPGKSIVQRTAAGTLQRDLLTELGIETEGDNASITSVIYENTLLEQLQASSQVNAIRIAQESTRDVVLEAKLSAPISSQDDIDAFTNEELMAMIEGSNPSMEI